MKNFEFEHNGQKLWYSRSLAVSAVVHYTDENNQTYILVNKRGQGAEFNKGVWNLPGGFMDFNESAEEAACRETMEETGYILDKRDADLIWLDTYPRGKRQTFVAYYNFSLEERPKCIKGWSVNDTNGEVELVAWMNINEIDEYLWLNGQEVFLKQFFGLSDNE
jgi:8-oxo-dGTP pyrophosphatase MutT (NUDIX family)